MIFAMGDRDGDIVTMLAELRCQKRAGIDHTVKIFANLLEDELLQPGEQGVYEDIPKGRRVGLRLGHLDNFPANCRSRKDSMILLPYDIF